MKAVLIDTHENVGLWFAFGAITLKSKPKKPNQHPNEYLSWDYIDRWEEPYWGEVISQWKGKKPEVDVNSLMALLAELSKEYKRM